MLFDDGVTLRKGIAIIVIVVFSLVVAFDRKQSLLSQTHWFPLALLACTLFGTLGLSLRYAYDEAKVSSALYLAYVVTIVCIMISIELVLTRVPLRFTKAQLPSLIIACISYTIVNLAIFEAFTKAPNAGYVSIIVSTSTGFVVVISYLIFDDHLSIRKSIGIVGMLAGLALMVL